MKKRLVVLIVLIMSVGFAAIATNLFLNGQTAIAPNQDDFDVYYSDAYVNGKEDLSVITSDRVIEFTTTFESVGEEYILDYEVTNGSKNYDAELVMECTSSSEYLTVTNEFDDETILEARNYRIGKLTIEQTKSYIGEDLNVTISCTINANALERDTLNEDEIQTAGEYVIEGYYKDESNGIISNANLIIFSETPHYVTTDESGYLFYNGLERGNHEIYHVDDTLDNIKEMTKEEIISNAIASAEFTTKTSDNILLSDKSFITNLEIETDYSYCEKLLNEEIDFDYTGSEQEFLIRCNGEYKVELWGAQGGSNLHNGAYVSGEIELVSNNKIYVYVGGKGNSYDTSIQGGYNGGGNSTKTSTSSGHTGGGATDIRLVNGTWNNFDSLKSRIIVAAGGGGTGGSGGGLQGYDGDLKTYQYYAYAGKGATQIAGGTAPTKHSCARTNGTAGSFGQGGTGGASGSGTENGGGSGGGSGYYGGSGASGLCNGSFAGGGGSSFISGHTGCDAISESSTSSSIKHTGQSVHYSGYQFKNTVMIDGEGYSWTDAKGSQIGVILPDGTESTEGNEGDGYARITLIGIN